MFEMLKKQIEQKAPESSEDILEAHPYIENDPSLSVEENKANTEI
jgi:hypothetical protein